MTDFSLNLTADETLDLSGFELRKQLKHLLPFVTQLVSRTFCVPPHQPIKINENCTHELSDYFMVGSNSIHHLYIHHPCWPLFGLVCMTTSLNQLRLEFPSKEKDLENDLDPKAPPLVL